MPSLRVMAARDVRDGRLARARGEYVAFALRQRVRTFRQGVERERRIDHPPPGRHLTNGDRKLTRRRVLEDEAHRAGLQRLAQVAGPAKGRDDQHATGRDRGSQGGRRGQSIHPWHLDIQHRDVGPDVQCGRHDGVPTRHLGHDDDVVLHRQQRGEGPAHE